MGGCWFGKQNGCKNLTANREMMEMVKCRFVFVVVYCRFVFNPSTYYRNAKDRFNIHDERLMSDVLVLWIMFTSMLETHTLDRLLSLIIRSILKPYYILDVSCLSRATPALETNDRREMLSKYAPHFCGVKLQLASVDRFCGCLLHCTRLAARKS